MNDKLIKKIAIDFYNHYHSFSSLDVNEEFDKWWTGNEHKYSQWKSIETAPKEKPFIEVRDYLYGNCSGDFRKRTAHKKFSDIEDPESSEGFIRWLDDDWRKVEI